VLLDKTIFSNIMHMAQIVRTVDGTPVPTAQKVKLYGNPRAVTNVGVGSTFLFVGQRDVLRTGSVVHIATKQIFPGSNNFWYLLRSSQHTTTYWTSAMQLRDMINEEELLGLPNEIHSRVFPGKARKKRT
jgi:hypothetical protein